MFNTCPHNNSDTKLKYSIKILMIGAVMSELSAIPRFVSENWARMINQIWNYFYQDCWDMGGLGLLCADIQDLWLGSDIKIVSKQWTNQSWESGCDQAMGTWLLASLRFDIAWFPWRHDYTGETVLCRVLILYRTGLELSYGPRLAPPSTRTGLAWLEPVKYVQLC